MSVRTTTENWGSGTIPHSATFVDDGKSYCAVRLPHGLYTAVEMAFSARNEPYPVRLNRDVDEVLYHPPAPGTTVADVNGATHALDDGTHWHFVHASPGEHYDREALVEALLIAHFQPRINAAAHEALSGISVTLRTRAAARMGALNDFVNAALKVIETDFRKLTLGHHERVTPQADNRRALVAEAVRSVRATWLEARDILVTTKVGLVSGDVNALLAKLTEKPPVLTRAVAAHRAAEAAKKKAAAEAETPATPEGEGS